MNKSTNKQISLLKTIPDLSSSYPHWLMQTRHTSRLNFLIFCYCAMNLRSLFGTHDTLLSLTRSATWHQEHRHPFSIYQEIHEYLNIFRPKQNNHLFVHSILNVFSWMNFNIFWFKFNLNFCIRNHSTNSKSALVQVMAWHLSGAKPLPEPLLIHFTNAFICPQVWMSFHTST